MHWQCTTKEQALGIRSIADLAAHAGELTIAGDYEIFARPEWRLCARPMALHFRAQRQMQPEFMYRAAADGDVDVISAYTSDGQIATTNSWCSTTSSMPFRHMMRSC